LSNFIEWESLEFKKQSGKEKLRCPSCDGQRTDKKDRSLLVNHKDGYGKCFYCDALTFRAEEETKQYTEIKAEYKKPPVSEQKVISYINTRKISESTLKSLYVTIERYYQPAKQSEVDNIVFNYYEGSKLVNKKYRSADKKFTQTTGGKPIFYNINSVIGNDEVYIVEGEFDVLAMYEAGYKNAISVPNGANDNDEYWINSKRYLENVTSFIIATDNDTKGIELRNRIAQRLGRYRCKFIEWQYKDANGDLMNDCINDSIKSVKRFPVNDTYTSEDLKEGVLNLYDNGLPKTIYPLSERFRKLSKIFSVMKGQLTVVTGIPSHGKSNFVDDYVINLIKDYNFKSSWFSPEHTPMELYETNIIEKVIGRNFWKDKQTSLGVAPRITKQEIDDYTDWAKEKIYLTECSEELPTWDWLLKKFEEQMYSFGIDIFVIDAFNKVILPSGNKLDEINVVLSKLTHFAQANNVLIFLVAHPTKMKKNEDTGLYAIPDLYSVSGSADFRNQTHNGFTIYRTWEDVDNNVENTTTFYNMKIKFKFQGEIGASVDFDYCLANGRYYEKGTKEPLESLIHKHTEKKELPRLELTDAFDEDIPF